MKILFFGDIVGKAGRAGIAHCLPRWRKEHSPDLIVANVENIAHGFGISKQYLEDLVAMGVDVMTGGNHIVEGKDALKLLADASLPLLRPANAPASWPGRGHLTVKTKNETPVTIINLMGQAGMREHSNLPFDTIETVLAREDVKQSIIMVDWHAEMTSEKNLLGWYLDGRVSAVLGTHTHVPTADEKVLPQGTAYITDTGMVGAYNSIIGVQVKLAIERIAKGMPSRFEVEEKSPAEVNAVLFEVDEPSKKALWIKRLREIVEF
jgi:hypothetical protein